MDVDQLKQRLADNWPGFALAAVAGLGIGYAVGAKLATTGTTKRERGACDARVSAAEKAARRSGVIDARRAVDGALNDLAARPNPFVVETRAGRRLLEYGEFDDPRDAREAVRYLEASRGEDLRVGYTRGRGRRRTR